MGTLSLREMMVREMRLRCFETRTKNAYLKAVEVLARYYKRSPDKISCDEVHDYLIHLLDDRKMSWGTVNSICVSLRFFYNKTLRQHQSTFSIPRRRTAKPLPEVLNEEELERLFSVTANNLKNQTLIMTAYSTGLRISEVVALKVTNIDSVRMMVHVENGKGKKDRPFSPGGCFCSCAITGWHIGQVHTCFHGAANVKIRQVSTSAQRLSG